MYNIQYDEKVTLMYKYMFLYSVRDKWDQVCDWDRVMYHKSAAGTCIVYSEEHFVWCILQQ